MPAVIDFSFNIDVQAMAQSLDELDYFQVLKVAPTATAADLKRAFYGASRRYHPDQFHGLADAELKAAIGRIYKRVTEAYVVLRDEVKRAKYAADVAGPARAKKIRFTEESELERKAAQDAEFGKTPNGRKFFAAALVDLQRGNVSSAERNLKLALAYEPSNAAFTAKLTEIAALQKGAK